MEQPTNEQIIKLWEWCGFKRKSGYYYGLIYPDKTYSIIPKIDLNNIFKYAIPKLQDDGYQVNIICHEHKGFEVRIYDLIHDMHNNQVSRCENDELSLALFGAINQVIK